MTTKEQRVASYAFALDDPNQLDASVEWVSNGARGYLHGNRRCHRLPRHPNLVTHQLSVRSAAQRNCCDSCFDQGVARVVIALREMQLTMTSSDNVATAASQSSTNRTLNEDFKALRELDYVERSLKNTHAAAQEHGFITLHDRSRRSLSELQAQLRARLRDGSDQILRLTAVKVLDLGNRREMTPDLVSTAEERLFGSSERSYTPPAVARLYQAWLTAAAHDGKDRTAAIADVFNGFQLTNISQLEGLTFGGTTVDLAGAAKVRWYEELAVVSDRLIRRWDNRFDELMQKSELQLVAVQLRRLPQGELTELILACHTAARNAELDVAFLKVPMLVAEWLDRETRDTHTPTKNRAVVRLASVTADGNTLDTAVKLWDPRSETYHDPNVCLTAAVALNT